jgi:crossover junction endodeoxyribonuclease RuvC
VRIFGIDPGSIRTGYGCVDTDGRRHRLVTCGVLSTPSTTIFPDKLKNIHSGLTELFADVSPDCVVVENLFHARNVRSALILGHARGVAVLTAVMAGLPVVEYSPAEIKLAVSGYGRAPKPQLGRMVKLLLGLDKVPTPHDAADALAVAICHAHSQGPIARLHARARGTRRLTSWRHMPLAALARRQAP